ncbi:MAG: hypothetical protein KBG25_07675 [Paludibacteraceae bacterium]|nr:hypothetical protein [Paludibacteraceae bacterium]
MIKELSVKKQSGTYAEALEALGLAELLFQVLIQNNQNLRVIIKNSENEYKIISPVTITNEMIENTNYFQLFKYIKKDGTTTVPETISDYYDYQRQRTWKNEKRDRINLVNKDFKGKEHETERNKKLAEIEKFYEETNRIDTELDVITQLAGANQYASFTKLYFNFYNNCDKFSGLLKEILYIYSEPTYKTKIDYKNLTDFNKDITCLQLFNPNQGKGLNKDKANGLNATNFKNSWVTESLKVTGALHSMLCQLVKVGTGYDMKIFVPEYNEILYDKQRKLVQKFKKYIKANTPIKIDILNILLFTKTFIELTPEFRGNIKNTLNGFYSVYQKDLGQNKAVVNIAHIQTPDFININSEDDAGDWVNVLNYLITLISRIDEQGDAIQGLLSFRNFLSSSNLESFFRFCRWYSVYFSQALAHETYYKLPISPNFLNKLFKLMETENIKLTEIIENEGFKSIAKAIRKSTVSLQYTPKEQRKFEIRYGLAQEIQNKSKSKTDLATLIGEFVGAYNAETARVKEKTGEGFRATVKEEEILKFIELLDKYPSRLVGSLLSAYGFALEKKDALTKEGVSEPKDEE